MKPKGECEKIAGLVLEKLLPALKAAVDSSVEAIASKVAFHLQPTLGNANVNRYLFMS
jgi:hypothetical protein